MGWFGQKTGCASCQSRTLQPRAAHGSRIYVTIRRAVPVCMNTTSLRITACIAEKEAPYESSRTELTQAVRHDWPGVCRLFGWGDLSCTGHLLELGFAAGGASVSVPFAPRGLALRVWRGTSPPCPDRWNPCRFPRTRSGKERLCQIASTLSFLPRTY